MAVMPPTGSVDEFTRQTAVDALALARKNEQEIEGHEKLCAERYANINQALKSLRAIFTWAGGALFTLILAAFGFLINQTMTANHALNDRNASAAIAAARIERLEDDLAQERRHNQVPQQP